VQSHLIEFINPTTFVLDGIPLLHDIRVVKFRMSR